MQKQALHFKATDTRSRFCFIPDLLDICLSILAGLVSITCPCGYVDSWAASLIGFCGGLFAILGSRLQEKLKIDDPVGAWPVHGIGGVWGVLSCGLFDRKAGLCVHGHAELMGTQVLGCVAIIVWTP